MDSSDVEAVATNPPESDCLADVKHPLNSVWALWYFKNDKRRDWSENQKVITTFGTVEDFWA